MSGHAGPEQSVLVLGGGHRHQSPRPQAGGEGGGPAVRQVVPGHQCQSTLLSISVRKGDETLLVVLTDRTEP